LGSAGLFGNRPANLAVQKSDLLIGLGYRFSVPQTGYDPSCYAPDATILSVEIDPAEFSKIGGFVDVPINSAVEDFLAYLEGRNEPLFPAQAPGWTNWCKYLMDKNFDPSPHDEKIINSFEFNRTLEKHLEAGDTVVTDMGTSFTCTHQDLWLKAGVRLFTSSGVAAMGFGLPGAIGCSNAKSKGRTVLVSGDGGLMFNLQDLQTIATFQSNVKIIVYENGGYLTMKHMQEARFKKLVGSESGSFLQCADFVKVGNAFGVAAREIDKPQQLPEAMLWLMNKDVGPKLLVVHIDPWQPLLPRVQTRSDASGRLFPPSIDQMFPYLSEDVEAEIEAKFRGIDDSIRPN
jgi:acetolactate synthase-1/2/3 large subunit